jgi:hypothetical protein
VSDDILRRLKSAARDAVAAEPTTLAPEAVQAFEAALIEAHVLRTLRDPVAGRAQVNALLRACIELINSNPTWKKLKYAAPLAQLSGALGDLSLGSVQPILRPDLRDRRDTGPRSLVDSTLRGHAAGVIEGLMAHEGMKEPEAAKWVSRELGKAGIDIKASQLIEWRKQARHPKKNPKMREAFYKVQTQDWASPKAAAIRLLAGFIALRA